MADSYAGHLVLQTLHPGMERRLPEIIELLERHLTPNSITLRHDAEVRQQEGLPLEVKTVSGELPDRVEVREGGVSLWVDIRGGQKTGLFLDQRENRLAAAAALPGAESWTPSPTRGPLPCTWPPGPSRSPWWRAPARPWSMAKENGQPQWF